MVLLGIFNCNCMRKDIIFEYLIIVIMNVKNVVIVIYFCLLLICVISMFLLMKSINNFYKNLM